MTTKTGKKILFHETPEGMNLAGRIQAIKYMKSKNYEQGDLQKIEANACTSSSDLYDPNLPSGWKYRYVKLKSGHSRMFFITLDRTKLTGEKQLLVQLSLLCGLRTGEVTISLV